MSNEYTLAMYDVRAKQKFIYRSQHLKEIIGGSAIISDVFDDYLYDAAKEVRNKLYETEKEDDAIYEYDPSNHNFSIEAFKTRMNGQQYIGEVIYNGGGNYFVLYKNEQICRDVTSIFTRNILEKIGTLKVICTYITDINENDYKGDQKKLYEKHRYTENQEAPIEPYGTLPIVQADYLTSMPLTNYYQTVKDKEPVAVTKESYAKYCKYDEVCQKEKDKPEKDRMILDETVLDNLVTKKGEESLLAIIYIDGNNMGAKVAECNQDKSSYDDCINNLRRFSSDIQKTFIDDRKQGIDDVIRQNDNKKDSKGVLRLVVGSGDEITIITNARVALEAAKSYLEALPKDKSSCAGISIFHSHTPFAEAYRIAEECCESGKQYMKKQAAIATNEESRTAWENACMIDYHFNQGAIGVSLEDIRDSEQTVDVAVPWIIVGPEASENDVNYRSDVETMKKILHLFGRGNTKGLLQAARESNGSLTMEIRRIRAHMDKDKAKQLDAYQSFLYEGDNIRKKIQNLLIRMIPVYDIWFSKEDGNE